MNYQVLPDKNEIFENAFRQVLEAMNTMEGHSVSKLYKDIDDQNSYLIISDWSEREAFDAFIKSDKFKKVTNWGTAQVLAGRPQHEVYER